MIQRNYARLVFMAMWIAGTMMDNLAALAVPSDHSMLQGIMMTLVHLIVCALGYVTIRRIYPSL